MRTTEKISQHQNSKLSTQHEDLNNSGFFENEKHPFKLLHRIAKFDIIIGMAQDCFFILFACTTHWRDYTSWSILFCTAQTVLAIFNNAFLMSFNRTEISKEFSIFSIFWLIYRTVFLIAILIMTSIIFCAWTLAIIREAQFSVAKPNLFSFFGYIFLAVLLGGIIVAVRYIPGGFRARLDHIQYRNYIDLDLDSHTVNVQLSEPNRQRKN